MSDRQQTSDDWEELKKSRTHAPPPDTQAMTREQLEKVAQHHTIGWGPYSKVNPLLEHDAAQRETIRQQAQELETIRGLLGCHRAYIIESINDLKAKTDDIPNIDRIRQAEQEIERLTKENASLAASSCEAPYGDDYGNKRCKTIDDLQSKLAAMGVKGVTGTTKGIRCHG